MTALPDSGSYRCAAEAAADAAALAANPSTGLEEFAAVVAHHLEQWVGYPRHASDQVPEYQIPVDAPGERAAHWWTEIALMDTEAAFGVTRSPWHDEWLIRRAFAAGGPEQLEQVYRRFASSDYHAMVVTRWLIALLRHRSLAHEQPQVLGEPFTWQQERLDGWDDAWHRLRRDVPERTSRSDACDALAGMLLDADTDRAALLAPVRRAVVSGFLVEGPERISGDVDDRVALLTADDLRTLVSESGRCVNLALDGWAHGIAWPSFGLRDAGRSTALSLAPLDRQLYESHLGCPAPSHRVALALNPFTPTEVGLRAIDRGLEEAEHLLGSRPRRSREAHPAIRQWWRALMAARGWFPEQAVQEAMQRVSAWMLSSVDPIGQWLRPLAVFASSPDELRAMSRPQLALFDALVADRAARTPVRWRRTPGGDPFAAMMSPAVLRQVLAATGWVRSGLLVDPAIVPVLDELPHDLRVEAARRGDDLILRHLVRDPEPRVRQFAARNRRADSDTLDLIVSDQNPRVRSQVARNAGISAQQLVRMSRDPDRRVSRAASRALLNRLAAA